MVATCLGLAGLQTAVAAEGYPEKPVTIIVPFNAGGAVDISARLLADELSEKFGQPFTVVNRGGGAGTVGFLALKDAAADGYTILFGPGGSTIVNQLTQRPPFDLSTDFDSVATVHDTPLALVMNPTLKVNTVEELIQHAKDHPGVLNGYSTGTGGLNHFALEMFNSAAGVEITHIPYNGGSEAIKGLLANEAQLGFDGLALPLGLEKEGKVKILVMTGQERMSVAPNVPTLNESALPGFVVGSWNGFWAPKGTPEDVKQILYSAIQEAVEGTEIEDRLERDFGVIVNVQNPEEMQARIDHELARMAQIGKDAGIITE